MGKHFWLFLAFFTLSIHIAHAEAVQEVRVTSFSPAISVTCYHKNAEWMQGRKGGNLLKLAHLPGLVDEYAFRCVPFATSNEVRRVIPIHVQVIFPTSAPADPITLTATVEPFRPIHLAPIQRRMTPAGEELTWGIAPLVTTADWHLVSLMLTDATTNIEMKTDAPLVTIQQPAQENSVMATCHNGTGWTFLLDAKNSTVLTRTKGDGKRVAASFACN